MFWLGLLLAVCYVPGYTGASVPTQWAVLSILLPACLWRVSPIGIGHKLFCAMIAYALLSVTWSYNYYASVWGLWLLFIWTLSYHLGTQDVSLESLWKGLAIGLTISTGVAVAQGLDFAPVEAADPFRPAGLLFNSSLAGVVLGLVLTGLICHKLWWYTPPLAIGLLLSTSRGGILVLAIGLLARYTHWLVVLAGLVIFGTSFVLVGDLADSQRLQIWGVTLEALSNDPLRGFGIGSFVDLHYVYKTKNLLIRPEFVHNDIIQLAYEFGVAAVFPFTLFGLALANRTHRDWPVLVAFVTLALFFFPLYAPITAFIGLVVAGSCLRDRALVRDDLHRRRSAFVSWVEDA